MTIRAIETHYAGCRFRSRLEARWAVFFDTLGIQWEYEPQGFYVGRWCNDECPSADDGQSQRRKADCIYASHRRRYLPDFFLPETETWVEVKGTTDKMDWQLMADATDWGTGLPGLDESLGTTRGLLILGSIPRINPYFAAKRSVNIRQHAIIQHQKGLYVNHAVFAPHLEISRGPSYACFDSSTGHHEREPWTSEVRRLHRDLAGDIGQAHIQAKDAYLAARAARFEHGERG